MLNPKAEIPTFNHAASIRAGYGFRICRPKRDSHDWFCALPTWLIGQVRVNILIYGRMVISLRVKPLIDNLHDYLPELSHG
jgi:hypothetical protein